MTHIQGSENNQHSSSTCPFCHILSRQQEAAIVYESEFALAFLDARPLFPGHTLLIPKAHYVTLADLPDEWIGPYFADAKLLARAVERAMSAEGLLMLINNRVSQSVPHLHVHLIPRNRGDGLKGFLWPRSRYRDEQELRRVQTLIADAVRDLRSETAGEEP
jgi:histidine triad (HIT) family protein